MSGLLAARVCADHFVEVLILEKDIIDDSTTHRKGVPQDNQIHILLSKGYRVLSYYFPNVTQELENQGAISGDLGHLLKWYCEGGFRPNCEIGENSMLVSRPLLEKTVRDLLLENEKITLVSGAKYQQLLWKDETVIGVRTNQGDFYADFTIDATGVGSKLAKELTENQFPEPEIEKVKVNVRYTSFVFPRKDSFQQIINTNANPPFNPKHGTLQAIENGKMIAMVQGRINDIAPTDIESFKAYCQELETQEIYEMIKDLQPISKLNQYHIPYVRWIHYEKMKRFPKGMIPFGDAICRLNPAYGQGMSASSIQAEILDQVLEKSHSDFNWQKFFKGVAKEIQNPWDLTITEDFKFEGTEGTPPKIPGILVRYFTKLNRVVNNDPVIFKSFAKVLNMMNAPTILLKPNIIWRVIRAKS